MKVSSVKNLFPRLASGNKSWIQKHPPPEAGGRGPDAGEDCHLVVSLALGTSAPVKASESPDWGNVAASWIFAGQIGYL